MALPGYFCKTYGEIISKDEYFSKPDCFELTKLKVLTNENSISEFTVITRYHDTCTQGYIDGGLIVKDILKVPQFVPDYKVRGKTFYFKIAQDTFGSIRTSTGGIDELYQGKIPNDTPGIIHINSIMVGYDNQESSEFKDLPTCQSYGYNNTVKNVNNNESYISREEYVIYLIGFTCLCLGIFLGYYLRKNKSK